MWTWLGRGPALARGVATRRRSDDKIVDFAMYIPALRDFGRYWRANIGIMYALTLPVLMFVVGVAIDSAHAAQVRTQLNAAADAAVFAALTPAMDRLAILRATAQTAAQNMFNGQSADVTSLAAGDTTVTVTVTNPNGNALHPQRHGRPTAAQNNNMFAGALGVPTLSVGGTSSATASTTAPNINFYLLLDNSPSMALPSSAGRDHSAGEPHSAAGQLRVRLPSAEHERLGNRGKSVRQDLRRDDHIHHADAQGLIRERGTRTAPPPKGRKSTTTSSL